MVAEVAEQSILSGFHQSFSIGGGEQLLKYCHGVSDISKGCVAVTFDGVSDLDSGIDPLVGNVPECVIVVSDFQWRAESE